MKILITGGNGNIAKIIQKNLSSFYDITTLSRNELNVYNYDEVKKYLENNFYDILIHTAILGGRRTKEESKDTTHINLVMLENLLKFANKFKMIINLDSAAIYDRSTDIFNRKEKDLLTIPNDYYGFSKYVIYKRSLQYNNFYNLRIFNIFHPKEDPDRFIKSCFTAKKNKSTIFVFEDKYFDFFYEDDFIKLIKYYFDNIDMQYNLEKTINVCYKEKYKLSEIAKLILENENQICINSKESNRNYSGENSLISKYNLEFNGLEKSLIIYADKYLSNNEI